MSYSWISQYFKLQAQSTSLFEIWGILYLLCTWAFSNILGVENETVKLNDMTRIIYVDYDCILESETLASAIGDEQSTSP